MVFYPIIKFYVKWQGIFSCILHAAKLRGITLNLDAKFIDFSAFVHKSADVMEWDVSEKNQTFLKLL